MCTFPNLKSSGICCLVCRLTLFKARRGSEPSCLLMREWTDAKKSAWLAPNHIPQTNDELRQALMKSTTCTNTEQNLSRS